MADKILFMIRSSDNPNSRVDHEFLKRYFEQCYNKRISEFGEAFRTLFTRLAKSAKQNDIYQYQASHLKLDSGRSRAWESIEAHHDYEVGDFRIQLRDADREEHEALKQFHKTSGSRSTGAAAFLVLIDDLARLEPAYFKTKKTAHGQVAEAVFQELFDLISYWNPRLSTYEVTHHRVETSEVAQKDGHDSIVASFLIDGAATHYLEISITLHDAA